MEEKVEEVREEDQERFKEYEFNTYFNLEESESKVFTDPEEDEVELSEVTMTERKKRGTLNLSGVIRAEEEKVDEEKDDDEENSESDGVAKGGASEEEGLVAAAAAEDGREAMLREAQPTGGGAMCVAVVKDLAIGQTRRRRSR